MTIARVHILRRDNSDGYDCTNGGISSPTRAKGKYFFITDEGMPKDLKPYGENAVFLAIVRRTIVGKEYLHVEPIISKGNKPWFMAGGNFVYNCGVNFSTIFKYPLSIHDRVE